MNQQNLITDILEAFQQQTGKPLPKFFLLPFPHLNSISKEIAISKYRNLQDQDHPVLLISQYVNPNLGQELYHKKILFLDTAGNCFIETGSQCFFILGQKPKRNSQPKPDRFLYQAGIKLIFALLLDPKMLNATYRDLRKLADISLGSVGPILKELQRQRYLAFHGSKRHWMDRKALFERWIQAYAETLRPQIHQGSFRWVDQSKWEDWKNISLPTNSLWGSESATALIHSYLRPGRLTIYTRAPVQEMVKALKLIPDDEGDVELLRAFWHPSFDRTVDSYSLTPILLTYADLLLSGEDRNWEAAQQIYEQSLSHFFQ